MAIFYLDTSALVKRYRTERGADVVGDLLTDPPPEDRFYLSFLTTLDLISGILRLVNGGQLREDLARAILARFRQDALELFRVWPLDDEMITPAVSVVERFRLRSGDAIHLASALELSRVQPGAHFVMVSADRELLDASSTAGLATLDPEEAGAHQQLSTLRQSGV